jgi:hypothetical protein
MKSSPFRTFRDKKCPLSTIRIGGICIYTNKKDAEIECRKGSKKERKKRCKKETRKTPEI